MGEVVLSASDLVYRYPGAGSDALSGVAVDVVKGQLVSIVGPNGSGKTTLLRILLGLLHPVAGTVLIKGRASESWSRKEMARLVGVVPQREVPVFPLRLKQAVMLGRYPHLGPLGFVKGKDHRAVAQAMDRCDISHLSDRWTTTLSGGEWQRVRIARALAQDPEVLVLDEPTAGLDIKHEMEVFELAAQLARDEGMASIMVTHQVNLAARFSNQIIVLDAGRTIAAGVPTEVLNAEIIERVFDWPVNLFTWKGIPQFLPKRTDES